MLLLHFTHILFIYGGLSLHFQCVFISILIFPNPKHENSSYKLHYNKNFMFPTSNDPDLMVCITISDGRELGGRELQKKKFWHLMRVENRKVGKSPKLCVNGDG
jgi:hypothetical protein